MTILAITSPSTQFFDTDGSALDAGYVYIGEVGMNPETHPIPVYWDAAGTQPAPQPIRTLNGYLSRSGSPAQIFTDTGYSITVRNKRGKLVISSKNGDAGSVIALAAQLSSGSGASIIGWIRNAVGAVFTTLAGWLNRQNNSLFDFMTAEQIADSQTATPSLDHTIAIQAWLATLGEGKTIYLPSGKFNFSSFLSTPLVNRARIYGDGSRRSILNYIGTSNNGDLLTIGNVSTPLTGLSLLGFSIDSSTDMTGGTAIRIQNHVGGSNVKDVSLGETNANRKLWDGIWFDNVNVMNYDGFRIYVKNEGLIVNGTASTDEGSDLWLDHGFILGGVNPIHCGGGFGGLYLGQVLAYGGTGCGMLIDQARANRSNREIVLSDECVLDGANSALLRINNPGGILIVDCNAFLSGAGFFSATPGDNIDIQSMPSGRLTIGSSHIKSAKRHGVKLGDNATFVTISNKTMITDCVGWGIFSDATNQNVSNQAKVTFNTAGQIHPNVQAFVQTGTGIGSTSGTITSSSGFLRYRLIGGVCECYSELTITNNGTGSGALIQILPFPMKHNCIGHGVVTTSGRTVNVRGDAVDGSNVSILHFDGTYPGTTGAVIRTWIKYEVQQ